MITTPKMLGLLAVAFVAGSFVASPELRAYAAATIGSADIIDESIQSVDIKDGEVKTADLASNAVTAAKIKDGEVKAAEIATDAVGAAEIQGVSKLLFGQCNLSKSEKETMVNPGLYVAVLCTISGIDTDDSVVATLNHPVNICFDIASVLIDNFSNVQVLLRNECDITSSVGLDSNIGLLVYDK